MRMNVNWNEKLALALMAMLLGAAATFAQAAQQKPPAQTPGDKPAQPQAAPLTLESTPPPVNAEEEAAYKAFHDAQPADAAKKDQLGEELLQKYPQSRYRSEIYNWQVKSFYSQNKIDKMEIAGDKELELTPNDPQTLAIVGSALPRSMGPGTPDPQKRLAKAEQYCQKSLDLLATLVKPDGMTDEVFQQAKNQTSALAYGGLGLVAFRRGKYAEAIPDLEQALKLDPQPDPVNYYLLGVSSEKTSHFDDAVAAFTKCAAIPSGMQGACTQDIEEAKKLATTQLSAPK